MKKETVTSSVLATLGLMMIVIAIVLSNENVNKYKTNNVATSRTVEAKNMTLSKATNIVADVKEDIEVVEGKVEEVKMEELPKSEVPVPPRIEVFEGLTMEELTAKLDRNLGSTISGKGYVIAANSINLGIDPYLATAIILHETGCRSNCSALVRSCNNVGGQKGGPSCNGGAYKAYPTLDEGIIGYLNNLHRNYYSRGLTTPETIGPKYAASEAWSGKIHSYIASIRNN